MTCATLTSFNPSTTTATVYSVVVEADDDPGGATVEFAWPEQGTAPSVWSAGTWVDDDADGATDKISGAGAYGWHARTPIIGPLTAGWYTLHIRLSPGGGDTIDFEVATFEVG